MRICAIAYAIGNVQSVVNTRRRLGSEAVIVRLGDDLVGASPADGGKFGDFPVLQPKRRTELRQNKCRVGSGLSKFVSRGQFWQVPASNRGM